MAKKKKPAKRRKSAPAYEEAGFSLAMPSVVRERPLDSFALGLAGAATIAIVINATMFQTGAERAPAMRAATVTRAPASEVSIPAPRPAAIPAAAPTAAPPPAQTEDPNMLVREVQAELARRGLYDGPADGLFGPKTEAAIFDFEIGAGLKPTGRPNPQLLTAMRASSTASAASPKVAQVQRVLDQQGFGPVKVDGVAGEATRAAIRRFEASRGLPQRGEITPAILRKLSDLSGVRLD